MQPEMTSPKTTVIYLSGAGLAPTIWDTVRSQVTAPGITPTYSRNKTTSLKNAVDDLLRHIQDTPADRYVIVAHSLAGVIGVTLARALGDKLCGFVAVSATIPAPGKSFVSTLPFPQNIVMPFLLKIAGTKPPVSAIRKGICNDLTDKQSADIISAFTPEPTGLYTDETPTEPLPAVKYLYIRTTNDKQTSPSAQSNMAKQLPNVVVTEIAGGHLAMVSHPTELATKLNDFIAAL